MTQAITVNGEAAPLEVTTVAELLAARGVNGQRGVAVALNDAVVPRPQWPQARLQPGDRVEIIRVVGGG
jgi:sulfur carrier protein